MTAGNMEVWNMKKERCTMDCCIGCRNYQRCRVCDFENDVVCKKYRVEWVLYRIEMWIRRRMG